MSDDTLRAALDDVATWLEAEAEHPRPDPRNAMRLQAAQARAALAASATDEPDHALHFDPSCEECVYLARPTVIRLAASATDDDDEDGTATEAIYQRLAASATDEPYEPEGGTLADQGFAASATDEPTGRRAEAIAAGEPTWKAVKAGERAASATDEWTGGEIVEADRRDALAASATDEEYHEHVAGDKHSHAFNGPHSHGGVSALVAASATDERLEGYWETRARQAEALLAASATDEGPKGKVFRGPHGSWIFDADNGGDPFRPAVPEALEHEPGWDTDSSYDFGSVWLTCSCGWSQRTKSGQINDEPWSAHIAALSASATDEPDRVRADGERLRAAFDVASEDWSPGEAGFFDVMAATLAASATEEPI